MSYLDLLRTIEGPAQFPEKPPAPSVESVETPSKPALETFDTGHQGPFSKFPGFDRAELQADRASYRCWLIHYADGTPTP